MDVEITGERIQLQQQRSTHPATLRINGMAYSLALYLFLVLYAFYKIFVWLWKYYILNGYQQAGEAES